MAEIEAGKRLQKERNAPSFISKNIQDLERKLKDTNELAQAKHSKLKVSLKACQLSKLYTTALQKEL